MPKNLDPHSMRDWSAPHPSTLSPDFKLLSVLGPAPNPAPPTHFRDLNSVCGMLVLTKGIAP